MAFTGEIGELVESFRWLTEDQSKGVASDPKTARPVRDELVLYLVRLSSVLGIDLNEAVKHKRVRSAE